MVYSLPVREGAFVNTGDLLVQVADLHKIRVRAFVDEPEIGKLQPGQLVEITWDALPGRVWKGTIETLPTTVVQHGTRMVGEVTCVVENQDLKLLPNTNVSVAVVTMRQENALTVPREAIHQDADGQYVFEVVNGELKRRNVTTSVSNLTQDSGNQRPFRQCSARFGRAEYAILEERNGSKTSYSMKFFFTRSIAALALFSVLATAGLADPEASQLLSAGRVNDAVTALTSRQDAASLNLLSRAYFAMERWDEAVKYGERAVNLEPQNATYHLWLGREYGRKAGDSNPLSAAGLAKKAKNEFERAVQLDPSNVPARVDLARVLHRGSLASWAEDWIKLAPRRRRCSRSDPAMAHLIRARVAEKDKRYSDAEAEYQAAIQQSSESGRHVAAIGGFLSAARPI